MNYFNKNKAVGILLIILTSASLFFDFSINNQTNYARAQQGQSFRFISWSDQQSINQTMLDIFSNLSDQAVRLNPDLTVFVGDLQSNGFDRLSINSWENSCNGTRTGNPEANNLLDKTFVMRGNHDCFQDNPDEWQAYFNMSQIANNIQATHYSFMPGKDNLVYSFDYKNSHFVTLDAYSSQEDVDDLNANEIAWLDNDLYIAETRNIQNTFIFFHVPIYCVGLHCHKNSFQDNPLGVYADLVDVINRHPSITATFHAHEHLSTYTFIDSSRIKGLTHFFHHFVSGRTGGGSRGQGCDEMPNRHDYCLNDDSFLAIDVDGLDIEVNFYKINSNDSQYSVSFSKPSQLPKIDLTKLSSVSQISSNGQITYTIQYYNNSNTTAYNITIEDSVPLGTSYVNGSATNNGQYLSGKIIWDINELSPHQQGSVNFSVKVN